MSVLPWEAWSTAWPSAAPMGWWMRGAYPEHWVRFHSLPLGKRYAEDEAEVAEVRRRHEAVLRELAGSGAIPTVLTFEYLRDDGTEETLPPVAQVLPWEHWADVRVDEGGEPYDWTLRVLAATLELDDPRLAALLRATADDEMQMCVVASDATWAYAPYDGGADVLVADQDALALLRERHRDWLPYRANGL